MKDAGKTFGALACVVVVLILWAECLAALLRYAQAGDPGAYIVAAGVFMMLPLFGVFFIVLLVRRWDTPKSQPAPTRRELPAAYGPVSIYRQQVPALPAGQAYAIVERRPDQSVVIRPVT